LKLTVIYINNENMKTFPTANNEMAMKKETLALIALNIIPGQAGQRRGRGA
jgi:hypothetical protein